MKCNVLIVDDEENIRFAFKAHLAREGCSVDTVSDFESAVAAVAKTDYDMIFADIILGGKTGIDVLREVKKKDAYCPVIIITGEPNIETSAEAVRLGAFDYIPKPVRKQALLRVATQALRHKSLTDEKNRIVAKNKAYRKRLEAIFKSLQDAVITVDSEMRVVETNTAAETICGVSKKDAKGKRFTEAFCQCAKVCHSFLKDHLANGRPSKECRIACERFGRARQVASLVCSQLADAGQPQGAVLVIRDITRLEDLEKELARKDRFHGIIGNSPEIGKIVETARQVSGMDTTVLITGETGTGKDLVANAIHHEGLGKDRPFVKVNCAALSENLLESELFGHVKGAFTGAVGNRAGRFQAAEGGTLFLDEIGDLPVPLQIKLLKVIEDKKFEPVGSSKSVKANVRLIAATNRDLRKKTSRGAFREDLYYRIKVLEIHIPPLRKRKGDIPLLANHFRERLNVKYGRSIDGISKDVMEIFRAHRWPGNVRELEHVIEHAFVLCRGDIVELHDLPEEYRRKPSAFIKSNFENIDEQHLTDVLAKTDWNKAKAARILGISRPTLYKLIEKFGL